MKGELEMMIKFILNIIMIFVLTIFGSWAIGSCITMFKERHYNTFGYELIVAIMAVTTIVLKIISIYMYL